MESLATPCIRCGKQRVKGKERTYFIGATKTKSTIYVCPDKECQKQVEKQLAAKEERRLAFADRRSSHPAKKKTS